MISEDPFSQCYADLLDDTYDVVDRIVLNAYYRFAQSTGGFRSWWRQWHGSDDNLDDTRLMRLAGRFSRRVRGWAKKNSIPVVDCKAGERKHLLTEQHLPKDPDFEGIFLVLVGRAPAPVWQVQRSDNGIRNIRRKNPMPWVNHYHFHILDKEWGHITFRVCGHVPFNTQVMLNGHEYVACQARKAGIDFTKEGNCFTDVSSAADLSKVADALRSRTAVGRLLRVCERWIYRCVAFGLSFDEQKRSGFRYAYSVFQLEYSRNLLFTRGRQMDRVFAGVIDRTRGLLDVKKLKTIFGFKNRPTRKVNGKPCRFEVQLENPVYDLTVFKVHFGRLTLKVYTKGERVLRIEAVAHNTKELRCRRSVGEFGLIVIRLADMVERFLQVVHCVDVTWIDDETLEALPLPSKVGETRVGGVDINNPRMRAAMHAVVALASAPSGFTASDHAAKVRALYPKLRLFYTPRRAAYDIKKLRGKGLVRKIPKSRRYEPSPDGLRAMAAIFVLRDKVIKPLLASRGRLKMGRKPKFRSDLDVHYDAVQRAMQQLFKAMKLAA
jgi:hypothetical protein